MQVTIIGAGYVGLTTGVTLAYLGHKVTLVDKNPAVISSLEQGKSPIYEYGMDVLLPKARRNISFTTSYAGIDGSRVILIAVGTPSKENGDADLGFLEDAVTQIAHSLSGTGYPVIVNKSTVPPGTASRVKTLVNNVLSGRGLSPGVNVASNPEFLREGSAFWDALYPDRIVVGAAEPSTRELLTELYQPIIEQNFTAPPSLPRPEGYNGPVLFTTNPLNAELIKYASNAFLAMKVSFVNEFAGLAELLNADIVEIAYGMGLDSRIGNKFLQAGVGWGGSCFGKDARAILYTAKKYGYSLPLVQGAIEVNNRQKKLVTSKIRSTLKTVPGSTIGIMGLAFKPGTDDCRETPATGLIAELLNMGAFIKVYDPMAMDNFQRLYPDLPVEYATDLADLADGCDALVLLTEWEQFKNADWPALRSLMKKNIFIDGRNLLDPRFMEQSGFVYRGVGRHVHVRENTAAAAPKGQ